MKNLFLLLLIAWIVPASCQSPIDVKSYYIKIAPFGLTDVPLHTLFISTVSLDSIADIHFNTDAPFTEQKIITDERTMRHVITFINQYDHDEIYLKKPLTEFGCHHISVYNRNSLNTNFDLDLSGSKKFLNGLIDMLVRKSRDTKLIDELKDDVLAPID